jgi:hypothetical protein
VPSAWEPASASPASLPVASAKDLVTSTLGVAGQFSDETYCASPSGAFVAGDDAR